jgi:beta-lactamase regulating signal transducer with metallopeptidase domain
MMPVFFSYLLKLSVSLSLVFVFYQFVLRRLTFYNWNRFYLVIYTLLSFFIPFINVTSVLERNEIKENGFIRFVPSLHTFNTGTAKQALPQKITQINSWSAWDWVLFVFLIGIFVLLMRLIIQLLSFKKITGHAELISAGEIKLYQVDQSIIPFSFGRSIFINRDLHTEEELKEIIRHEIVHVAQKHSFDIIWSEVICIFNWYNPFAWLIRKAIRQNLEFIADNKVLQSGIDKKRYQYLLLKVIGNNHFSIAPNFNFSSLKKRIAMMNKMKSAKLHLVKFLFVLPLMAVLLLAFRSNSDRKKLLTATEPGLTIHTAIPGRHSGDTLPLNNKGYVINMVDKKGNCTIVVKNKNKKEIKRILLTEWNQREEYYNNLYGSLPEDIKTTINITSYKIDIDDNSQATVSTDDGNIEKFDLNDENEKKEFTKKYAMETTESPGKNSIVTNENKNNTDISAPVVIETTFSEKNIGTTTSSAVKETSPGLMETTGQINNPVYLHSDTDRPKHILISGRKAADETPGKLQPVTLTGTTSLNSIDTPGKDDTLKEVFVTGYKKEPGISADIALKLKNNVSLEELKRIAGSMKRKGFEFKIDKTTYRNGKLSYLEGTLEKNDLKKSFTVVDFLEFIVIDNSPQGINDFNFWINGGRLVWQ